MFVHIYILFYLVSEFGEQFEGDMILSEQQLDDIISPSRNGLVFNYARWPNKTVYYELSPDHMDYHNNLIEDALKKIEAVSCIKFERRTNQNEYIQIIVNLVNFIGFLKYVYFLFFF